MVRENHFNEMLGAGGNDYVIPVGMGIPIALGE
jgi:hypothetical protein